MSNQRRRVQALEQKAGSGFCVIVPIEFDVEGQPFDAPPSQSDVRAIEYSDGKDSVHVKRDPGEEYWKFKSRALSLARLKFADAVILEADSAWI